MTPDSREQLRTLRSPLKPAAHVNGVDAARLLACLGVIWFHSGSPYNVLGYFRNPFFTVLLTFLVADGMFHPKRHRFGEFVALRALRILVPFAIWMIVYRIPNLWTRHLVSSLTWDHVGVGLGATHLWYLPFAFCISIMAFLMARLLLKLPPRAVVIAASALLGSGIMVSCMPLQSINPSETWGRWSAFLGCAFIGPAMAFLYQSVAVRKIVATYWPMWIVLWLGSAALSMGSLSGGFGALSGLFLVLAGLSVPVPNWPNVWRKIGSLTYGAYLTHLAFFLALDRLGFKGDRVGLIRYAIMVVGAFATADLLQRFPWGRFMIGMRVTRQKQTPRATPAAAPAPAYVIASTAVPATV